MVVVDAAGRIVLVNARTEAMFGYERRELLGQPVEVLIPERLRDSHAGLRADYNEAPRSRPMGAAPGLPCRRRDGAEFPGEIALSPIETEDGRLVVAAIRDLSEHRRLEEALATNLLIQRVVSQILQTSLEPIGLKEHLQRTLELILSVPWFGAQAMGGVYLAAEAGGSLSLEAEHGLAAGVLERCRTVAAGRCLCGRAASHREIVFASRLDEPHESHPTGIPQHGHYCVPILAEQRLYGVINIYLNDPGHEPEGEEEVFLASVARVLAGTIERKRAEAALRESEERFDLAVRGTDAGVWDWDLRTNRVYFSPRWKSILGHTDVEIADTFPEWESRLHPEDRERAFATVRAYLEGQTEEYELEHRLRHKDGTYRWILARGAAVRDAEDRPYRMVGSHIDVTEHRRAIERLQENAIQLRAAQKIQQALLPAGPPSLGGLDIAGFSHPAESTGGDLYDYLGMLGGALGLMIGDVSGHGVPSAILMASTQAFLRCLAQTCATVAELMTRVNRFVYEETRAEHFVTLLLARYNPGNRQLVFANAGHPSGLVLDARGELRAELLSSAVPLGILEHVDYPVREPLQLAPGDLVVLLTDGILEAESPSEEAFGIERVLEVVRRERSRSSREILESLHRALREHLENREPADDLTAVIVKVER